VTAPARVTALAAAKDMCLFVFGWALILHQAWIFQTGGEVSLPFLAIGAIAGGVPGIQRLAELRMGVSPSSSTESERSEPPSLS
jgi:hypothetical protein